MNAAKRLFLLATLTATILVAGGCGSSPSNADNGLSFAGQVGYRGESFHEINLTKVTAVTIDLVRVRPLLLDVTGRTTTPTITLAVGIGQVAAGNCEETSRFNIAQGGRLFYSLNARDYCISVADNGSLPEEAKVDYALEVKLEN